MFQVEDTSSDSLLLTDDLYTLKLSKHVEDAMYRSNFVFTNFENVLQAYFYIQKAHILLHI